MKARDRKLFEWVGSSENLFDVPPYQRTYHWDKENIKKLINDVEEHIMIKNNGKLELRDYYFGNIIVKRNSNNLITLVDGQQRVTTCILIAKVLHRLLAKKLKEKKSDKHDDLLLELRKVYFYYNSDDDPKIKLNNLSNNHKLEDILNDNEEDEKESDDNYNKNFKFLLSYFKPKEIEDLINYTNAFRKLNCAVIFLENYDNENLVFESINSKGKKLQQCDLIKNYIFSISNDEKIYDYYNNVFLKNFKNYKEETEFYRLFDSCINGKPPESINGTKIYESFKKRYKKNNDEFIFNENDLEELKEFLAVYKYCLSLDISEASRYISKCAFSTYLPWIYSILFPKYNGAIQLVEYNKEKNNYEVIVNKENEKILKENLKLIATYDIKRIFSGYGRVESAKSIPIIEEKIKKWWDEKENNSNDYI
ncbi:MAG: DUF262 domain-containing protein, partial [Malacoplasma sp.]|nr:DUF262 domain-containing protein [Malacoplasma sp.]